MFNKFKEGREIKVTEKDLFDKLIKAGMTPAKAQYQVKIAKRLGSAILINGEFFSVNNKVQCSTV